MKLEVLLDVPDIIRLCTEDTQCPDKTVPIHINRLQMIIMMLFSENAENSTKI